MTTEGSDVQASVDRLLAHPQDARRYEVLKLELATRYADEPRRYQEEKSPFIEGLLARPP